MTSETVGSSDRPRPRPGPVYALADVETLGETAVPDALVALAEAGVRWVQIRAKSLPEKDLFSLVEVCFERLGAATREPVDLWMDDRADVAALFPFAGVHLGQRDLPPAAARRVVGPEMWIGASTHDEEELRRAVQDPEVDVVAVGPVFPTSGKKHPDPVVGLDFVHRARASTDKTLVAIGGIGPETLGRVLAAGADTAAVLGAVCGSGGAAVRSRARRLVAVAEGGGLGNLEAEDPEDEDPEDEDPEYEDAGSGEPE